MKLTPKEIRDQRKLLSTISTENIRCRVGGVRHWWDPRQPLPAWRSEYRGAIVRASQCVNCGAIKREVHSKQLGERLDYRLWHPDGYLVTKPEDWNEGTPLMSSAAVRLELHARIKEDTLDEIDLNRITPGGGSDE